MRKSNNYNKFLEYIAFGVGGNHGDAVYTDNGVLECVAEARVEDLEGYSKLFKCKYGKMAMDSDTWLKFKVVLVNEDVIKVYYVADLHETHIGTFVLDNFRTQKDVLSTVHQKVVEFFLNSDRFCKLEETEETTEKEDCKTVKEKKEQYFDTDALQPNKKIENINHCPNQNTCCIVSPFVHCDYNYKSDTCIKVHKNFIHDCEQLHKQMKAKSNPEWHHVSLATLANIDMLDEKRQRYFKIYKELIKTVNDLHKCKTAATYETRWWRFKQAIADDICYRGTTLYMTRFLDSKISMCNVECGLWSSADEKATSFIKSRRYRRTTLK